MRPSLQNAAIALLALGLLVFFLRNANLGVVWLEIKDADIWLLLVALITTMVTMVFRALRWQYLLAPIGATQFRNAFRTTMIGFGASAVLPARAGELLRPYLLARKEGLSATAAFATIVIERLLDSITVVLLLVAFIVLGDGGPASVEGPIYSAVWIGALIVAAAALAGLVLMFVAAGNPSALSSWALTLDRVLPAGIAGVVARLLMRFAEGLAVVRAPRRLLVALAWSFPLWLSIGAGIWTATNAFHIDMPFGGAFLVMSLLVVGVSVPTPGGVGGFHEAYRLGVTTFYGAPNDRAVGAAIVLHTIFFLPVALVALVFVVQDGMNLGGIRKLARAAAGGESGEVPVLRSSRR